MGRQGHPWVAHGCVVLPRWPPMGLDGWPMDHEGINSVGPFVAYASLVGLEL